MRVSFFLFFALLDFISFAQQRDTWYFGNKAGLRFSSTGVTAITGAMDAIEACAVQNDANGNALFYTDGSRVWDKFHNLMPNGTNLSGGQSATQTIIIPRPGSCRQFYIFSASDHLTGSGQLTYSMVDLALGTAGDVAIGSKNIVLHTFSSEKIAAVRHANGVDFWVVTHELESTNFNTFLVSASGVSAVPVTSSVGSFHASICMIGSMKISPDGSRIALTNSFCSVFETLDLNRSTGQVSNPVSLTSFAANNVYGLEFSPSGRFLYASQFSLNILYQIDLNSMTAVQVADSGLTFYDFSALERGPDGKIYMARDAQNFISAINFPDVAAPGCDFVANAVTLAAGTNSEMGLPSFIADDYPPMILPAVELGPDTALCGGSLLLSADAGFSDYLWNTGATLPQLLVTTPGAYSVQVSNACGTAADTIEVSFAETDTIAIQVEREPCSGTYLFSTEVSFDTYLWDLGDGDTSMLATPSHSYSESGTYDIVLNASDSSGCSGYAMLKAYFKNGNTESELSIPNVFTPNDDNVNDQFMVTGIDSCSFKALTIYNRWGEEVFHTKLFSEMWDGHLRSGAFVPSGIYYYVLELASEERKGFVQLHR